jgi:hypothetical protein
MLGVGVDPGGLAVDELDSVGLERPGDRERHVARRSLAERDPDKGPVEQELVGLRNDRDVGVVPERVLNADAAVSPAKFPPCTRTR